MALSRGNIPFAFTPALRHTRKCQVANVAFGALDAPNVAFGAPNVAFGALSAPNAAFGALSAPNVEPYLVTYCEVGPMSERRVTEVRFRAAQGLSFKDFMERRTPSVRSMD